MEDVIEAISYWEDVPVCAEASMATDKDGSKILKAYIEECARVCWEDGMDPGDALEDVERELVNGGPFLQMVNTHRRVLKEVYSPHLFHYGHWASMYAAKPASWVERLNPLSDRCFLRQSRPDALLDRVQEHWARLPAETRVRHPFLSQFEPLRFVDLNRALITGAEKIADLTHSQKVYLDQYVAQHGLFSVPFEIRPAKLDYRTRHGNGLYDVRIHLPLPASSVHGAPVPKISVIAGDIDGLVPVSGPLDLTMTDECLTVPAFVKDFNSRAEREREEAVHRAAAFAGCHGPRLLYSHSKVLVFEYAGHSHPVLETVRGAIRRQI